jgi:hypothetical protein
LDQRVDDDVNLRALAPFRAVVASPRTALGRGLQRAAVDARCRRLALASGKLAQQNARVFDQTLEASRPHPALHLLKNCRPRRIIVRHEPPLIARPCNVANAVEDSPQIVLPMGTVLAAQQQIRQHKRRQFRHARWGSGHIQPKTSVKDRDLPPFFGHGRPD